MFLIIISKCLILKKYIKTEPVICKMFTNMLCHSFHHLLSGIWRNNNNKLFIKHNSDVTRQCSANTKICQISYRKSNIDRSDTICIVYWSNLSILSSSNYSSLENNLFNTTTNCPNGRIFSVPTIAKTLPPKLIKKIGTIRLKNNLLLVYTAGSDIKVLMFLP